MRGDHKGGNRDDQVDDVLSDALRGPDGLLEGGDPLDQDTGGTRRRHQRCQDV
jgi:hypothetical protein